MVKRGEKCIKIQSRTLFCNLYPMAGGSTPEKFDVTIAAIKKVGGINKNNTFYKSPTTVVSLTTLCKQASGIWRSECIKRSDNEGQHKVDNFLNLLNVTFPAELVVEHDTDIEYGLEGDFDGDDNIVLNLGVAEPDTSQPSISGASKLDEQQGLPLIASYIYVGNSATFQRQQKRPRSPLLQFEEEVDVPQPNADGFRRNANELIVQSREFKETLSKTQQITSEKEVQDDQQPCCSWQNVAPPSPYVSRDSKTKEVPEENPTPGKMLDGISPVPVVSTPVDSVRRRSKQLAEILADIKIINEKKNKVVKKTNRNKTKKKTEMTDKPKTYMAKKPKPIVKHLCKLTKIGRH
ncbi:hypothetical protein RN001_005787 [Aquatica leii]|uniref:Uncharacterized protein n=1 Tax=Aquatica leii TaxID=1421715 RepID=A0AAN7QKK1_9COLE|nr:hypothetical protein RN001_005787 [Aquatica leii]